MPSASPSRSVSAPPGLPAGHTPILVLPAPIAPPADTPSPSPLPSATVLPSPSMTPTPSASPSESPTPPGSPSPTPSPTSTPQDFPSPTPSTAPSPSTSPFPSASPSPSVSVAPSPPRPPALPSPPPAPPVPPAPNPAPPISPPPAPEIAPVSAASGPAQWQTWNVEVWNQDSTIPQRPARQGHRFEIAYLTGTEPAQVRLQFQPVAAGKSVIVKPGPGVTIDPPETALVIGATGECVVSVSLAGSFRQSDITVYYAGARITLPLARTTPEVVAARETARKGGR